MSNRFIDLEMYEFVELYITAKKKIYNQIVLNCANNKTVLKYKLHSFASHNWSQDAFLSSQ
jgi:hypothetical protein